MLGEPEQAVGQYPAMTEVGVSDAEIERCSEIKRMQKQKRRTVYDVGGVMSVEKMPPAQSVLICQITAI